MSVICSDDFCPLHSSPLVFTPQKPELLGKCIWTYCNYGIRRSDPSRTIQDVQEWNYTTDGLPAETLED
jgi:hypothetical protein